MHQKQINQSGFSVVEAFLIVVILGMVGFTGWYVLHAKQNVDKNLVSTSESSQVPKTSTKKTATTTTAPGYLEVKEWNLKFKIPSGLTDVQYQITKNPAPNGDGRLAVYAKPVGATVEYRSNYKELNPNGYATYAIGNVYRSDNPTEDRMDQTVTGKKIGSHYYYTSWAFSSLATGAGCVGLYGDSTDAECKTEGTAFQLVNQGDTALLNTIASTSE